MKDKREAFKSRIGKQPREARRGSGHHSRLPKAFKTIILFHGNVVRQSAMLDCGGGRVGYRADLVWSEPSLGGCLKLLQRPSFLPQRSDEALTKPIKVHSTAWKNAYFE